jgi:DNA primase
LKFLLLSATKGGKEKRTQGTESDTTEEQPKALVLITAIEPFTKPELINRTYDLEFSHKFKADDFVEDELIREIIKKRDVILSAILKFLQKEILPNFAKRKDYMTVLKKEYRGHSKARTDEFLALLMLLLEKTVKHIPYYDEDDPYYGAEDEFGWGDGIIRKAWIEYQDAKARDTETSSNNIIKMLDGLVREYLLRAAGEHSKEGSQDHLGTSEAVGYPIILFHPEYGLELEKGKPQVEVDRETGEEYTKTHIEFTASPGDIVAAFDRFCKNNGLRNPYGTASIFGERLKNDKTHLANGKWEIVTREGVEPYYKIVKGVRFWKFRKTLIR